MATARMEEVVISRRRLEQLERDREILDVVEASHAALHPGAPPYREQIGELLDAGIPGRSIWTTDARKADRAARSAALRVVRAEASSQPARAGADGPAASETRERRRRAGR